MANDEQIELLKQGAKAWNGFVRANCLSCNWAFHSLRQCAIRFDISTAPPKSSA